MSTPEEPATEGTSADHSRSGDDVADAIRTAEQGSSVEEPHDRGTEATTGESAVERSAGDPEMTEGQVVYGEGDQSAGPSASPGPSEGSSGVAQSVVAGRESDRLAGGEPPAEDPSAR